VAVERWGQARALRHVLSLAEHADPEWRGFLDDSANSHAGAGLGVRYDTGIGPIRFDIASPISGDTGDGVQFYVGLGQAF
jgi:outer membrane protein assembly factor BamA